MRPGALHCSILSRTRATTTPWRFTASVVEGIERLPACRALLAGQKEITPGLGFSAAFTAFRKVIGRRPLTGSLLLEVGKRLRTVNKLQMVLDIDAGIADAGLDHSLTRLSGLLADVSAHSIGGPGDLVAD